MKKLFLVPLAILLLIGFILAGCGTSTPTTTAPLTTAPTTTASTTGPTTTVPTTPATTSEPTSTGPESAKIVKIGFISDLTGTLGNQAMRVQDLLASMCNDRGGLKIGNDRYMVKVITYSNDNDNNKAVSAANRLVFQDHVNYILSLHGPSDIILPVTDPNNVLLFSQCAIWNSGLLDKWRYSFTLLGQQGHQIAVAGWLIDHYPEIKEPNGLAIALPDNAAGHTTASMVSYPYKQLGAQPQLVFFPADQRDLSSLGTKIKVMNPAWFMGNLGKVEDMALATSAAYDAGYRGNYFSFLTSDVGLLEPIFKPEVLEGFINACSALELNPCASQFATDMKNAYVAKYGVWDFADYMTAPSHLAIQKAMEIAGSVEVDAVAAVLHQGFSFDCPDGKGYLIKRPDMNLSGNCIDGVTDSILKQIKNKQAVVLAFETADEEYEYMKKAYPPLPPGQTPTIAVPK